MDSCQISESFRRDLHSTAGKVITCKAAVAWAPKTLLDVTEIQVEPPRRGEVRIKVIANALCHTDIYTLEGHDPEGLFPVVLGHEAAGIVESIGEEVYSVSLGDVVIPCYTPECRSQDCIFCSSCKTNLCPAIRSTQGRGLMPDETSRLSKDGKPLYHFMGCSTFAEYAVIAEISVANIYRGADLSQMCLLGCGVSTGWGSVFNTVKMEPGKSVVVFGLGALGLSVIQASKIVGARCIIGIDINEHKFEMAYKMGANYCYKNDESIKDILLSKEKWGYDYSFDCTGNVEIMRMALEVSHRGWGESCIIGVASAGQEIATRPFQLVTGRKWCGTAFGGWKSRTEVPKLVQRVLRGEMSLEPYITHRFDGLDGVNESVKALHEGRCLRAVISLGKSPFQNRDPVPVLESNITLHGGVLTRIKHWSPATQSMMTFSIFIPKAKSRLSPSPPVLYYLSGLTCTDDNARCKSNFAEWASSFGLAIVFPDTSPRNVNLEDEEKSWDFGSGAGFYVNATTEPWKKHYQMFDYISKDLPQFLCDFFPVDSTKKSICGHSMGGHGALIAHLKNPGLYSSVSAFSPICNPIKAPWGQKAFKGYLGSLESGKEYDATELIKSYSGPMTPILIDQGTSDQFLKEQLLPDNLMAAAASVNYSIILRMQSSYDHSYFFISSFMKDHVEFHARSLGLNTF